MLTLTPALGYKLPAEIINVKMNGTIVPADKYSYNNVNGKITFVNLPATGAILIDADAVEDTAKVTVTMPTTPNVTFTNKVVDKDSAITELTFTVAAGYTLTAVTATVGTAAPVNGTVNGSKATFTNLTASANVVIAATVTKDAEEIDTVAITTDPADLATLVSGDTLAVATPAADDTALSVTLKIQDSTGKTVTGAFPKNGSYTLKFTVAAKDGYTLTATTATVNDDEYDIVNGVVTVPVAVAKKSISTVALALNTTGVAVGSTLPNATTTTEGVTVTKTEWYVASNDAKVNGTKFAAAGNHYAKITLAAADGYELADGYEVTGPTVTDASGEWKTSNVNVAKGKISSFNIVIDTTGITTATDTQPEASLDPVVAGLSVSTQWKKDGSNASDFTTAGQYSAEITVTLSDSSNYELASSIKYTVNGENETTVTDLSTPITVGPITVADPE